MLYRIQSGATTVKAVELPQNLAIKAFSPKHGEALFRQVRVVSMFAAASAVRFWLYVSSQRSCPCHRHLLYCLFAMVPHYCACARRVDC